MAETEEVVVMEEKVVKEVKGVKGRKPEHVEFLERAVVLYHGVESSRHIKALEKRVAALERRMDARTGNNNDNQSGVTLSVGTLGYSEETMKKKGKKKRKGRGRKRSPSNDNGQPKSSAGSAGRTPRNKRPDTPRPDTAPQSRRSSFARIFSLSHNKEDD